MDRIQVVWHVTGFLPRLDIFTGVRGFTAPNHIKMSLRGISWKDWSAWRKRDTQFYLHNHYGSEVHHASWQKRVSILTTSWIRRRFWPLPPRSVLHLRMSFISQIVGEGCDNLAAFEDIHVHRGSWSNTDWCVSLAKSPRHEVSSIKPRRRKSCPWTN